MKRERIIAVLLVIGLGGAGHFFFARLSKDLDARYSDLAPPVTASIEEALVSEGTEVASEASEPSPVPELPALITELFPVPENLLPAVEFWKKVYAEYSSDQVIFHDAENLSTIHVVLDLSSLNDLSDRERERIWEDRVEEESKRIQSGLDDLSRDRLRSQTGLSDKFRNAVAVSGKYLPVFEQIFESEGIPKELTRLVFVESLFQENARSKVGAAGLWQFMPSTGRLFLRVDRYVDERFDPVASTQAAARLLKRSYDELGSWPLAVTAYNTGIQRMKKAVAEIQTTDIGPIVALYRAPAFGFASRNFYAEFLAALEIVHQTEHYFGKIDRLPAFTYDSVSLPMRATFPQIALWSSSSLPELGELNPSYASSILKGHFALPIGTTIRIPKGRGAVFHTTVARLSDPSPVVKD